MDADPSSEVAALIQSPNHIPTSRSLTSRLSPTTWNSSSEKETENSGNGKSRSRQNSSKSTGGGWFSWARQTSKSATKLNVPTVVFNDDDDATDAKGERPDDGGAGDEDGDDKDEAFAKGDDEEKQLGHARSQSGDDEHQLLARKTPSRPSSRCASRSGGSCGDPHGDVLYHPVPGNNGNNNATSGEKNDKNTGDSTSSSSRRKSWAKDALSAIYSLNPPPRTISADLNEFSGSKSALNSNHLNSGSHHRIPRSCSNTVSSPSVDNRSKHLQPWGAGSINLDDIGGLSQVVMDAIPRSDGQVSKFTILHRFIS